VFAEPLNHADHHFKILGRIFGERLRNVDAGVVDEEIDASKCLMAASTTFICPRIADVIRVVASPPRSVGTVVLPFSFIFLLGPERSVMP